MWSGTARFLRSVSVAKSTRPAYKGCVLALPLFLNLQVENVARINSVVAETGELGSIASFF